MPKITAALTALVLAGLLTGCSAPTDAPAVAPAPTQNAQEAPEATVATEPESKPAQAPTAAPVTVAPEEPDLPETELTPENEYLAHAGQEVREWGVEITDAELLTAGRYACEQLVAGVEWREIEPLAGAAKAPNEDVTRNAAKILCP